MQHAYIRINAEFDLLGSDMNLTNVKFLNIINSGLFKILPKYLSDQYLHFDTQHDYIRINVNVDLLGSEINLK